MKDFTLPAESRLYTPKAGDAMKVEEVFTFHPVQGGQGEKYLLIRNECKELAELLQTLCPPSRELSLAITNLQQVSFWGNAAIAIHESTAILREQVAADLEGKFKEIKKNEDNPNG